MGDGEGRGEEILEATAPRSPVSKMGERAANYIASLSYIVCDKCGYLWDIDAKDADPTECERCHEEALWRYPGERRAEAAPCPLHRGAVGMTAFHTDDRSQSSPTSSSEKSESGGAGAGVDLAAMLESSLEEARRYVNNPAAPHAKWMCMFSIGQTEALLARVRTQDAALAEVNTWLVDWVKAGSHTQEWQFYIGKLFAALAAAGGGPDER